MTALDARSFASMVDHTLLKPEATEQQIVALCSQARLLKTASVCVNGLWAGPVRDELEGSDVKTYSVVGFPLGAMDLAAVEAEASLAVDRGAAEVDMVIPVGLIKGAVDPRRGQLRAEVSRVDLDNATDAYRKLAAGDVTGRAVIVPNLPRPR